MCEAVEKYAENVTEGVRTTCPKAGKRRLCAAQPGRFRRQGRYGAADERVSGQDCHAVPGKRDYPDPDKNARYRL